MPRFTQHELLELQEHIRGEAATAHAARQFANAAGDNDLRAFCDNEARAAETNANRLMSLLNEGQAH